MVATSTGSLPHHHQTAASSSRSGEVG
jgi:hypothetical protein